MNVIHARIGWNADCRIEDCVDGSVGDLAATLVLERIVLGTRASRGQERSRAFELMNDDGLAGGI